MKVSNIIGNSGREIPNQFEIHTSKASVFQSYKSIIAVKFEGRKVINEDYYKYSNTTTKYTAIFFRLNGAGDLHEQVKDGVIELVSNKEFHKLLKELGL